MQETTRTHNLLAAMAAACLALFIAPALAPAATVATTSTGSTTTRVTTGFGDREILGVIQTVNLGEIKGGESAKAKATSADVKTYAQEMVRDHRKGEDQLQATVKAVGATRTSSLSKQLATDNREAMTRLEREKKAGFDRAYAASEVKMHQMVLDTIDKELMPAASNAKVKELLTATRATVAEHLQKAQALQTKLGG